MLAFDLKQMRKEKWKSKKIVTCLGEGNKKIFLQKENAGHISVQKMSVKKTIKCVAAAETLTKFQKFHFHSV